MGEVVPLAAAKQALETHMSGAAACQVCHHAWVAAAPIGAHHLECPECHAMKGYFVAPVMRGDERFVCDCGCDVFRISATVGPYCVNCATPARGWF
jgi:hypothetical protein